jgi:putative ABC transport system substrate-binding protein
MRRRALLGLAAGAVPFAVFAQSRVYRVAFLTLQVGEDATLLTGPLRTLGYVEGSNLAIVYRSAGGDPARLAALAEELVQAGPDVLVAGWGTLAPKALKAATATLPIVFSTVGDPVGSGLVQSLARPGGNVTGSSGQATEFKSKQLQLLLACVPGQKVVGVLLNPDTPYTALAFTELKAAADRVGVRLELMEVRKPEDFGSAHMDALVASGATSLFIMEDPLTTGLKARIVAEATRLRLPIMTGLAEFARAGALMTYGASATAWYLQTAHYVDKILKGAKPADLPVVQPTTFELVVNLKAAKAIGAVVPQSVLAIADEVIE